MAYRYVFEQWNVATSTSATTTYESVTLDYGDSSSFSVAGGTNITVYDTITTNADGTITLSGETNTTFAAMYGNGYYYGYIDENTATWYKVIGKSGTSYSGNSGTVTTVCSGATRTYTTTYSQGEKSYGYLYATSRSSYTTGRQTSGDYKGYWITYVGYDTIDPTAEVSVSGTTAKITVTAAAGTKYGGDISYIIERKINDRDWEEVSDGSSLTVSETVGSDLVTYTARVTAYCDGFTGDAVTSDTFTVSQSGSRYCWEKYSADEATDYGLVTDNDLSAHAIDGTGTDGYYYDYLGADDIDAVSVSYGGTASAGSLIRIDVTASSGNSYGGVAKYIYQYSTDGGSSWTTANSGTSATSLSMKVPSGSETFQARVQTIDDYGYTSTTWVYGELLTCDNNTAPTVLAASTALGNVTAAFTVNYDVTDLDGDALTITETLDGATLRTRTVTADAAAAGTTLTLSVTADQFLTLSNGAHTLTITAEDSGGKTGTATITFTKALYTCTATWLAARGTDSVIKRVYIGVAGDIPDSATVEMLVTNDNGVTWEDATEAFLSGDPYTFATTEADNPAFNFQLTCARGSDGEGGYIDDLSFILDTGEVSEYGNTVAILTHVKVGTVHQLTGLNGRAGMIAVQFKTVDSYDSGDTCTVEGETYTLQTATGADVAFETGRGVMAVVDTDEATVTLQL